MGWTAHGENWTQTVEEGIWSVHAESDAYIQTDKSMDVRPNDAQSITISMRVVGTNSLVLRWRIKGDANDFNDLGSVVISVPTQGVWNTYKIDTLPLRGWREAWWKIADLRLDLTAGTHVEMGSLRIESKKRYFFKNPAGTMYHSTNQDLRPSLYAVAPSSVEFEIQPEVTSRLSFGCATLQSDGAVTFKILVTQGNQQETIFEETLASNKAWRDFDLDLGKYAGETVSLAFQSNIRDGFNVAFWSNPLLYSSTSLSRAKTDAPLNVIVYLVDCLRADHLECYGYDQDTAPFITSIASRGTRFARCFTHETWTTPSVSSLFTGVPSSIHGVSGVRDSLPATLKRLPEMFRDA